VLVYILSTCQMSRINSKHFTSSSLDAASTPTRGESPSCSDVRDVTTIIHDASATLDDTLPITGSPYSGVGDVHDVTAARYVTATNLDDTLPMGHPVDEGTDETDILLHNRDGRPALSAPDIINTSGDHWKDPVRPDHQAGDFFCTQRGPTHVSVLRDRDLLP